jgi:diaminopimelate epimerase
MADFYKYHGLGNDYLVIDPAKIKINLTENNIKLICDRNFGVGSDGILYGPVIESNQIYLRIFNPDGSEAEKSGNGIRIFARYLWDAGYITESKFELQTKSGPVTAELLDKEDSLIKIDMGRFSFLSKDIPTSSSSEYSLNKEIQILDKAFTVDCVTIGNPHCVIMVDNPTAEMAQKYGPVIERYQLFPNRTNVQFVKILDKNNLQIEIWERGAGYTLASGSSGVASSCVAHKKGLVGSDVTVHMPGGNVNVAIDGNKAYLTGTARKIMEGVFAEELL